MKIEFDWNEEHLENCSFAYRVAEPAFGALLRTLRRRQLWAYGTLGFLCFLSVYFADSERVVVGSIVIYLALVLSYYIRFWPFPNRVQELMRTSVLAYFCVDR